MSEPFLGEIRIFAGNFAPVNWAFCNGAILPIPRYTALFSLLGTNFGGNGTTTFALPNLVDTIPIHWGTDTGGNRYDIGETGGSNSVTIDATSMASHAHAPSAVTGAGTEVGPANALWSTSSTRDKQFVLPPANAPMLTTLIDPNTGGSTPHENRQPYIAINYIIALAGVFPHRPLADGGPLRDAVAARRS